MQVKSFTVFPRAILVRCLRIYLIENPEREITPTGKSAFRL
jgi:hypothetical protein